jgi:prephenate dehydrogenase
MKDSCCKFRIIMPLNVTILGLDAVGASLGLALGTLDPNKLPSGRPIITGWDSDKSTLKEARGRLVVDRVSSDLAEAVRDADVVFISVPLSEFEQTLVAVAPHVRHGAIVTDVMSVKTEVWALARQYLPTTVNFIGGHPLVSVAGQDLRDASIDLFKDVIYCLVADTHTQSGTIDTMETLVTVLGAKPYYIDASEHDTYIAGVEHLPVLASVALMEVLSHSGGWREMQSITGSRFRAATTLVATPPETSRDMCLSNSAAIEQWITRLIQTLVEMRDNLHDSEQLDALFTHAQAEHERWLAARPNMRPGEVDVVEPMEQADRSISSLFFGRRKPRDNRGRR